MEDVYVIQRKYFDELMGMWSKSTVGKVMKRFEITSNPADIKTNTKELIYESSRELKALLDVHCAGYEHVKWEFVPKNKKGKG